MSKKILVVGSLNIDVVIRMPKMPQIGETVMGEDIQQIPGGKGANQACAVAKLGGDITMLGCVGEDRFGMIQTQSLQKAGVKIGAIKKIKNEPTGMASIYVDEKGDNSIVVVSGANRYCSEEYILEMDSYLQECDYVVLQMEIPLETIQYIIHRAKELHKLIILNPAPAPEGLPSSLYEGIDYIIPNETELIRLTGIEGRTVDEVIAGAKCLREKGVKNVVVTLGERGVMCLGQDGVISVPARSVNAVDTTAAGDCFVGGFAVALSEGRTAEEAIKFANLASSISVTRKGAQVSIPSRIEVEEA